jgi:HxlR-like helix-turn-helix
MKAVQGSRMVPAIFIGRWTPKVLFSLTEQPYRHGQLRRHVGSVSQRMLTRTLRNLESTGLIARRDEVEGHCGRVFLDATGKDTHRSTQRYVPLGKTIPQGRDCGGVTFANAPGAMSETWDVKLCFRSFERRMIEKGERS